MMKIIRQMVLYLSLILVQSQALGNIYLWEAHGESGFSCCLHINGEDICNPQVRCTQYMRQDISGILDYVVRLLNTEKSKIEPHHSILVQVKQYMRSVLHNPYNSLGYQMLERRSVRFYHEILDAAFKNKDSKPIAKQKSKNDEFVTKYLMKLGLLKKFRQ